MSREVEQEDYEKIVDYVVEDIPDTGKYLLRSAMTTMASRDKTIEMVIGKLGLRALTVVLHSILSSSS